MKNKDNLDVKTNADDSSTSDEANSNTPTPFDKEASRLVEEALSGSNNSPEGEEEETKEVKEVKSAVLKKNNTEEKNEEEKVEGEGEEKEEEKADTEEAEDESESENKEESEEDEADKSESEEGEEKADEDKDEAEEETKGKPTDKSSSSDSDHVPISRFREVNEKLTSYEPLVKAHTANVEFCQKNGIPAEQYRQMLTLAAQINTKPAEAVQALETLIEEVKISAGIGLPKDLDAKVKEGVLPLDDAKELAALRLQKARAEKNGRATEIERQNASLQEVLQTLSQWGEGTRKTNPDFKPKPGPNAPDGLFEDFVREVERLCAKAFPRTSREAIALSEDAWKTVQSVAKRYATPPPRRKVLRTGTSSSRSTRSVDDEAPKSMDDVVKTVGRKHGYNM